MKNAAQQYEGNAVSWKELRRKLVFWKSVEDPYPHHQLAYLTAKHRRQQIPL
jgi:hypothetical protein